MIEFAAKKTAFVHAVELVRNIGVRLLARGEGTIFPRPLRTTYRYISYPQKY